VLSAADVTGVVSGGDAGTAMEASVLDTPAVATAWAVTPDVTGVAALSCPVDPQATNPTPRRPPQQYASEDPTRRNQAAICQRWW
jgi:hypothetical protein